MKVFKNKLFFVILILLFIIISLILYIVFKTNNMNKVLNKYVKNNTLVKEVGSKSKVGRFSFNYAYNFYYPTFNDNKVDKIISKYKKEILKNKDNNLAKVLKNNYKYRLVDYESYISVDNIVSIVFKKSILTKAGKLEKESIDTLNIVTTEKEVLKDTYMFIGDYKSLIKKYIEDYIEKNKLEKIKKYDKVLTDEYNYKYAVTKEGISVYFNPNEIVKTKKILKIEIPYSYLESVINVDITNVTKKYNKTKIKKENFKDNEKVMYVKKLSNLYKNASKNSNLVTTLKKGTKVNVKKISDNYSYILNNDIKGYILNNSLSDTVIAIEGFTDKIEQVYAKDNVDIKSSMDDNSDTIVSLKFADEITRVGTNDTYSEVIYNEKVGFVKSIYLQTTKPTRKVVINPNVSSKKMVALTFDDGPNPSSTNRILDTLVKYNVKATFFDLGALANSYPDVVKREEQVGCEVGSHTYSHYNLNNLTVDGVIDEINKSKKAFENALGHDVSLVRPPYGNANETVKANIPYPIINWNVDTLDWKSKNKDAIVAEVRKIGNLDGKIVLMHSIYETTADAVEVIVPELINQGYELVTVSELASYKGVTLESGVKYFGF